MRRLVPMIGLLVFCGAAHGQDLPTPEQFDGLLRTCAAGSEQQFDADLVGSISDIYGDQANNRVEGHVNFNNAATIFPLLPEAMRLDAYRLYTTCIATILQSEPD